MSELMSLSTKLYPLVSALISVLVSQILKIIYFFMTDKKLTSKQFFTSGGMPSSHSALVMGLTTAIEIGRAHV